ncbi:hypothetical protein LIER_42580 [Lithospermum erythrorhizon]|uniref:Uncharacterized protein n=1 Tax=Lithospermum erythrorhizon TaxID=34254 RepID=A0AAV3NKL4_LITER
MRRHLRVHAVGPHSLGGWQKRLCQQHPSLLGPSSSPVPAEQHPRGPRFAGTGWRGHLLKPERQRQRQPGEETMGSRHYQIKKR